MTKSIEYMKNQMYGHSFSYEYVAFEEGYLTDIVYDACPKNTEKWNMEADFFSSIFFKQKITLTDRYCKNEKSMDKFAVGTDFSTELIVARIQYSDGSVKITKVKPTNVDELNNAKAGEHVLKWADNWGEYEVTITLY